MIITHLVIVKRFVNSWLVIAAATTLDLSKSQGLLTFHVMLLWSHWFLSFFGCHEPLLARNHHLQLSTNLHFSIQCQWYSQWDSDQKCTSVVFAGCFSLIANGCNHCESPFKAPCSLTNNWSFFTTIYHCPSIHYPISKIKLGFTLYKTRPIMVIRHSCSGTCSMNPAAALAPCAVWDALGGRFPHGRRERGTQDHAASRAHENVVTG